jgi:hypothetical protein
MKKNLVLGFFIGIAFVMPLLSSGSDKEGNYWVLGFANDSCGQVVENIENHRDPWRHIYMATALGYLSAYNKLKPDTYNILGTIGKTDADAVVVWIVNYCRNNPFSRLSMALEQLTIDLYPNRLVKKPRS